MVLKPGEPNPSLAVRDGMLLSLRCLTRFWGAHAFLLGCCGVPGAELKTSLQPAPTARYRQATDLVDINVSLNCFPWDRRSRSVPQGQIPWEVCAWRRPMTLPALGTR